jgi:hypothetical protein
MEDPSFQRVTREVTKPVPIPEKAGPNNTVAMPVDSGEYLFYHKSDGKFYQLPWNKDIHTDIVLNAEEMETARIAFRKRWPDWKWIAESYYDVTTGSFVY